jgi:hypothetical protein
LSNVSLTNRSDLSCSPSSTFTYMGEPIRAQFTLTAKNGAGETTANYTGVLAKLDLNTPANFALGALDSYSASTAIGITQVTQANPGVVTTTSPHGYSTGDRVYIRDVGGMAAINNVTYLITVTGTTTFSIGVDTSAFGTFTSGGTVLRKAAAGTDLSARVTPISSSGSWLAGVSSNGVGTDIPLVFSFARPASGFAQQIPEFGIAPVDADGVQISPYNLDISAPAGLDRASIGLTSMRYGRARLSNANGSELLNLPIPIRLEHWSDASNGWVLNRADTCTTFQASDFAFSFPAGTGNNLAACETAVAVSGTAPSLNAILTKPGSGNSGWTDVSLNLGGSASGNRCTAIGGAGAGSTTSAQPWLQFDWTGSGIGNPSARARFGAYKGSTNVIYFRELF